VQASEIQALREFRDSEAYPAWQYLVQTLAEHRAVRLLKPSTAEEHNFDRGVLFAYRELYDVVDRLISKVEEQETRERKSGRNGDGATEPDTPLGQLWGSSHFTDRWSR